MYCYRPEMHRVALTYTLWVVHIVLQLLVGLLLNRMVKGVVVWVLGLWVWSGWLLMMQATSPLSSPKIGVKLCPLHRRLDNALAMVEKAFGGTTLAEILAEPTSSKPLCDFPAEPKKAATR